MVVKSGAPSVCRLCLRERNLRVSHIIPKFAGKYLKDTSATGYLRDAVNPNIRRQDLIKAPLLCADCEQIFSNWESDFSRLAFPILQSDSFKELEYDGWLLKFAVSLSWRTLVTDEEDLASDFPQFTMAIRETLDNWRLFLLDNRRQPGSDHHLFVFAGIPETVPDALHPKFLHYVLRGIDATEAVGNRTIAVYVELLRSFFYSPIIPRSPAGWKNTRIHVGSARKSTLRLSQ